MERKTVRAPSSAGNGLALQGVSFEYSAFRHFRRKCGRVVYGTGPENRRALKSSVSSNLTASAIYACVAQLVGGVCLRSITVQVRILSQAPFC